MKLRAWLGQTLRGQREGTLPDGKPASASRITFVKTGSALSFTSPVDSDGTYTMKTSAGEGLPEGDYRVRVEIDESELPVAKGSLPKQRPPLPFADRTLDEDTSELTATVTSDEAKNNFEFKLANKPKNQGAEGQGRQMVRAALHWSTADLG